MMKTEANRFKNARNLYNKNGRESVCKVALDTGIPKSLISDIEADSDKPRGVSYITIKELATHYGVSADYLMGLTDSPKPYISVSKYTGLSEKAINSIIRMNKETGGILNKFFEELSK